MFRSATPPSAANAALLEPWQDVLARRKGVPAILAADGSVLRTFSAIEQEAADIATRLEGLQKGSIVAVRIGNSPSWPAVFLALLRGGFVTVPLSGDGSIPEYVHAVLAADLGIHRLSADPPDAALQGMALLKLTSGTTGAPRAIRFTAAQLAADCVNICATMGINADDLNYGVIPFAHSYGFSNLITPLLIFGVPLVASEDRFPRAILEGLRCTKATVFPGTPMLFHHLASVADGKLTRTRLGISAGAPLSRAIWSEVRERAGLELHTFYGASECGGIAYDRGGSVSEDGFVGMPMENVQLLTESSGQIEVQSAAVGSGYFPEPDDAILGGGRFRPSDLVKRTDAGLVLVGRVSDFINVAGRKLNPVEVEQRMKTFPGVRSVVVFGVESRLRGEEPVACVAGDVEPAALLRHAAESLPAWQVPKSVWFVDELPVNERGKISRRALAQLYLASERRS